MGASDRGQLDEAVEARGCHGYACDEDYGGVDGAERRCQEHYRYDYHGNRYDVEPEGRTRRTACLDHQHHVDYGEEHQEGREEIYDEGREKVRHAYDPDAQQSADDADGDRRSVVGFADVAAGASPAEHYPYEIEDGRNQQSAAYEYHYPAYHINLRVHHYQCDTYY